MTGKVYLKVGIEIKTELKKASISQEAIIVQNNIAYYARMSSSTRLWPTG